MFNVILTIKFGLYNFNLLKEGVRMNLMAEKYLSYIDGRVAKHNQLIDLYKADDRKDEADLEKIKVNIYEIFRTLFLTDLKRVKEGDFPTEFLKRFDTIPNNWRVSLEKAIDHGDTMN